MYRLRTSHLRVKYRHVRKEIYMTLNEMLQSVRDDLGETGQQYWKDAELERWAYLVLNRLARQGLCVEAEVKTNSLPGVQEYNMPYDIGELKDVRYVDDRHSQPVPLTLTDKQSIVTTFGTLNTIGTPYLCYKFQDKIGLYPIPHKPPILDCSFEGTCERFAGIYDYEDDEPFDSQFEISIEPREEAQAEMKLELDPCMAEVGHISLHLRRRGLPFDGAIRLAMSPISDSTPYTIYSAWKPARVVQVRPQWHHFDFMLSPLELDETVRHWDLRILADEGYLDESREERTGEGIQVGVNTDNIPYIQFHKASQGYRDRFLSQRMPPDYR